MTGAGGTDSNECGHCREVNDSSKSNVVTCITCKKCFHTSCVYLGGIKGTNLPHVNWLCNHCADAIRKEPTMKTDGLEELKAQLKELKDLVLKGFAEMRGEVNSAVKKSSSEMSVTVEDTVREVVTSAVMNARESMVNGESATEVTDWTEVVKRGNKKKGKNLLVVKANNNDEKATDRKLDIATALTGVPINDSSVAKDRYEEMCPIIEKEIVIIDSSPWYNEAVDRAKKLKKRKERQWRRHKTDLSRLEYTRARNNENKVITARKREYYQNRTVQSAGNVNKLYKILDNITGRKKCNRLPEGFSDDKLANDFIRFFDAKISNIIRSFSDDSEDVLLLQAPVPRYRLTSFTPITPESLKLIVKRAKPTYCANDPLPIVCCCYLLRDAGGLLWGSASLTLSVCVALVIVGGAWATYRPGLALVMLALAALPFIKAASMGQKSQCSSGISRRRMQ
ncbi:hypothetical protein Pcinc_005948 [Petrolisthes cinctipes]|uniref:PHD-type domain-containing protein n=1 Tax=Petrolisthes cinctipes TaxID=88211 RepID=A0AAE1KZL4_PETCI|nr:hypothetical protein Pcinc_005948 [Petrolisthes cinctipes]